MERRSWKPSKTSSQSEKRGTLYLFLTSLLCAGILSYACLPGSTLVVFTSVLLTGGAFALFKLPSVQTRKLILLCFCFFIFGSVLAFLSHERTSRGVLSKEEIRGKEVVVTADIGSIPTTFGEDIMFTANVKFVRIGSKCFRTGETACVIVRRGRCIERDLYPGRRIRVVGRSFPIIGSKVERIASGKAARVEASRTGVYLGQREKFSSGRAFHLLRLFLKRAFSSVMPSNEASLLCGVTAGRASNIDPEVELALADVGLSHIVAVSGLHIGASLVFFLFIFERIGSVKKSRYFLSALGVLAVLALSGFRPSASRAAVMGITAIVGRAIKRDYSPVAGLTIAAAFLLAGKPGLLFDRGFQLSFAATFGIIKSAHSSFKENFSRVRSILLMTVSAQLSVIPILVACDNSIPITAIVANIVVIPLVLPLMVSGWVLGLSFATSARFARCIAAFPTILSGFILRFSRFLGFIPPGVTWSPLGMVSILGYAGALLLAHKRLREGKWPTFFQLTLILASMLITLIPSFISFSGKNAMRLVFFDVGGGDAILIQDGSGINVLVDGGSDERSIVKKLRKRGITRIDLLVISHYHRDHIGGLAGVVKRFPVARVLESGFRRVESTTSQTLASMINERRIPRVRAVKGTLLRLSKRVFIRVLHPPGIQDFKDENPNNESVVLLVDMQGVRSILTGDVESEAQEVILRDLGSDMQCAVMKVPHQGSYDALNKGFLCSIKPRIAIISVKRGNKYGHPSGKFVSFLRRIGAIVLRTDRNGDIEVFVSDGRIKIRSER